MNTTAKEHFEIGKKKYFRYDRKGAVDEFHEALSKDPANPTLLGWLATSYALLGDYDEALSLIESLEEEDIPEILMTKGVISGHRDGNNQLAIEYFSKAISIDPNNEFTYAIRGFRYGQQNRETEAYADLDRALEINASSYVYTILAITRSRFNDNSGALSAYNKAIELDPENPRARILRAEKLIESGNYDSALTDLNKSIEVEPENWDGRRLRTWVNETLGNIPEAISDLNRAIELDPDNAFAWDRRANLKYRYLNKMEEAIADYNKAIELDPGNKLAWAGRSNIKVKKGDERGAIDDLNRALEIDKNYASALINRAKLLESIGKFELSMADRTRYYKLEGIPKYYIDDPLDQEVSDIIYKHLNESVKPEFDNNDERLIDYWGCFFHWGKSQSQSMIRGNHTQGFFGQYGMGYLCLSDSFLRVVSIGSLSRQHAKQFNSGIITKVVKVFALNVYDMRGVEKNDMMWVIPFKDIQGIYREDSGYQLITLSENWEIAPLWKDEGYLFAAIELARTGNLRRIIDTGKLRLKSKHSISESNIFEKIEGLASLRDKGIITNDEFEQKKKELLARM